MDFSYKSIVRNLTVYIIPLIGLAIVFLPYIESKKKELSYEILSESSIVDSDDPALKDVTVSFKGMSLSKLTAVSMRIANTGNIPITAESFESDLWIHFGEDAQIVSFDVSSQSRENLRPTGVFDKGNLLINPFLLNPNDEFACTVFVAGDYEPLALEGRISGITTFRKLEKKFETIKIRKRWMLKVSSGAAYVFIILMYGFLGGVFAGRLQYPERREFIPRTRYVSLVLLLSVCSMIASVFLFSDVAGIHLPSEKMLLIGAFILVPASQIGYRQKSARPDKPKSKAG
jgi:hypothetical protein